MSMAGEMARVARLAKLGVRADQIQARSLSTRTIEAIVSNVVSLQDPIYGRAEEQERVAERKASIEERKAKHAKIERARRDRKAAARRLAREAQQATEPDPKRILETVAAKGGITLVELLSDGKSRVVSDLRHEAMYILAKRTSLSLTKIGAIMRRDHSTVGHGVCAHAARKGLPVPRGYRRKSIGR